MHLGVFQRGLGPLMREDRIPVVEHGNALTCFDPVAHLYADRFDEATRSEAEPGFDARFGSAGKTLALDGAGGTDFGVFYRANGFGDLWFAAAANPQDRRRQKNPGSFEIPLWHDTSLHGAFFLLAKKAVKRSTKALCSSEVMNMV